MSPVLDLLINIEFHSMVTNAFFVLS